VKPQEAGLAHNQQHAPLPHTPLGKEKKKKQTSHKLFFCFFKPEVYGTISPQLLWFAQMQEHFHLGLTQCALFLWQRGIAL